MNSDFAFVDPDGFTTVLSKKIFKQKSIDSYSVIVHTIVKGEIHFVAGRLRDTIAFKEYLKGVDKNLSFLASRLTNEEKNRCLTEDLKDIADEVFVNHKSKAYTLAKNNGSWKQQIEKDKNILRERGTDEIWIFPKGRPERIESPIDTALREFEEETSISKDLITIYDKEPLDETYVGMDGKIYRTVYFIGYIQHKDLQSIIFPQLITKKRRSLNAEIQTIKWFEYKDICHMLDEPKRKILREFYTYLMLSLPTRRAKRSYSF